MSRWLRWLVVAPVVLFVFGAILLSCSGGSSGTSTASRQRRAFRSIPSRSQIGPRPRRLSRPRRSRRHTDEDPQDYAHVDAASGGNQHDHVEHRPEACRRAGRSHSMRSAPSPKTNKLKTKLQDITTGAAHTLDFDRQQRAASAGARPQRRHLHDGIGGMRLHSREQFRSEQSVRWRRRLRRRRATPARLCPTPPSRRRPRLPTAAQIAGSFEHAGAHRRGVRAF